MWTPENKLKPGYLAPGHPAIDLKSHCGNISSNSNSNSIGNYVTVHTTEHVIEEDCFKHPFMKDTATLDGKIEHSMDPLDSIMITWVKDSSFKRAFAEFIGTSDPVGVLLMSVLMRDRSIAIRSPVTNRLGRA